MQLISYIKHSVIFLSLILLTLTVIWITTIIIIAKKIILSNCNRISLVEESYMSNCHIVFKEIEVCQQSSPRSIRLSHPSDAAVYDQRRESRRRGAIKTRETFPRRHAQRVVREETCKRQTSSRRVSRADVSSLGFSTLFFLSSLSPVYPSSFALCLFFTLLTFFLYLLFSRSSHSPPGYATCEQARGIFASWNAANWPKINTHVEECYPFSLSFSASSLWIALLSSFSRAVGCDWLIFSQRDIFI